MQNQNLNLGEKLGGTRSIPEYIQVAICIGAMVLFGATWQLEVASVFLLIPATCAIAFALYALAHLIPALRSSLRVYEFGLETMVQGKAVAFTYDQLHCLTAQLTHHEMNHHYIGTRARIEFFVDGRLAPYIYNCEFRRGQRSELLVMAAIDKCSQAIQSRLLVELEREGAIRWRDNVSLTADGVRLTEAASAGRFIPYREIVAWKIVDNQLKIWKAGDALPCLVMGNETPNFMPLLSLFDSLASAMRSVDASCKSEPPLAACAN